MRRRPEAQSFGGQGVHREMEPERHEEKYRAVIDRGCPEDEPVGQRWGKVEPALWRAKAFHAAMAKPEGDEETPRSCTRAHQRAAKREGCEAAHRRTDARSSWLGKLLPDGECR